MKGKEVFFCTSNEGKFLEAKEVFSRFGVGLEWLKMELPESQAHSQREIAEGKAKFAWGKTGRPCLAEDTGICFQAYADRDTGSKDFPGIFTRFFITRVGYAGVERILEGVSKEAVFVTVVSFCRDGKVKSFVGECPGKIVSPKGEAHYKLPFDAIFVPKGYSKRFSELGSEVKNRISHRAIAFRKAGEWLRENGFGKN